MLPYERESRPNQLASTIYLLLGPLRAWVVIGVSAFKDVLEVVLIPAYGRLEAGKLPDAVDLAVVVLISGVAHELDSLGAV